MKLFPARFRALAGACAFILAFPILAFPATAEDLAAKVPAGFVHTEGKRFVGPDGKTFAIRGINLGNWLVPEGYMFKFRVAHAPHEINALIEHLLGPREAVRFWQTFRDNYVTEDDIRFIKAAGFNTVRIPLHYALFVDRANPANFSGPGYALLDRLIGWCRTAGLKVIIDMHAAPGGQTGINHDDGTGFPLVFYVPSYRKMTIDLWHHLAARYRNDPTVLGYDLLNEPISPYNDTDFLNPRLEPLYREITAAIREVDTRHVIFVAAAQWSTNFSVFGPPFDNNVAYTYHKFWASTERDSVQSYVNFSNRYHVPLFLGESGELTDDWNQAFRQLNERFGISWCFWTYKNLDTSSAVISVPKPSGWDALVVLGNQAPEKWHDEPVPADAAATLAAYLEAIKFRNGHINESYLASLGLHMPPALASASVEGSLSIGQK